MNFIRRLINWVRGAEIKRLRHELLKLQLNASLEIENERTKRKMLEEAFREFPHFAESTRITPLGVKIVAKQFNEQCGALMRLLELLASKQVLTEAKVRKAIGTLQEIEPDTSDIPERGEEFFRNARLVRPEDQPNFVVAVQGPFIKDDLPHGGGENDRA